MAVTNFEKEMRKLESEGKITRAQFLQIMAAVGAAVALGTDKAYAAKSNAKGKIVIIGGGAAGISMAAQLLRKLNNADITITGYTGVAAFLEIPAAIGGTPVKAIGEKAFYDNAALFYVIIPEGIESIGNSAFSGCSSLQSIHFGGTKALWEDIFKGSDWNDYTGNYTIYCTDGTITK